MSSVEEICDNIALINRSQVVLSGNVTEVKSRFRTNNFTIRFHTGSGKLQPIPEMFSLLAEKDLAGTSEVRIHKEPGITNSAPLRIGGTVIRNYFFYGRDPFNERHIY